jgi:hypothetical protein
MPIKKHGNNSYKNKNTQTRPIALHLTRITPCYPKTTPEEINL